MQTAPVLIDASHCNACGTCGAVCPRHVMVTEEVDGARRTAVVEERLDVCLRCGQCVAVCAKDAIRVEGLDPDGFADAPAWSIAPETFRDALATRRSVRRYKDRPVPRDVLEQVVAAAALAPPAAGRATTGVIVLDAPEKVAALSKIAYGLYAKLDGALRHPIGRFFVRRRAGKKFETLRDFVMPGFRWYQHWYREGQGDEIGRDAPAAVLFTSPIDTPDGEKNCVIAAWNAALMAHVLGLGACVNGLLPPACNRVEAARALVGLPEDREVHASITLGYPKYRYRRTIPRPLAEVRYV